MSCQDSEESFEEVSAHGGSADEGVEEEEEEEEEYLVFEDDDEEEVAENESDDFNYDPALANDDDDEEDDEKEPVFQQVVHLELPDGFWQSTSSGEDASPAHQESSVVFAEDAPASVSQASSSFVMAPPAAAKSNSARDVDDSSFTAWSHVQEPSVLTSASASLATAAADGSTTTTTRGDWTAPTYFSNLNNNNNDAFACPSSASSVVSGFDCIDVDGFTMRQCHLDGYVNEEGAVWCLGCGAALVANPCPEMDHQIALNLQNKEEKDALMAVFDAEQERDNLRNLPVLQQAQAFVEQIQTSLDAFGRLGGGILLGGSRGRRQLSPTIGSSVVAQPYHKVPPVDQVMAAVQFLERAKTFGGEPAFLGYVYGSQHPHRILAMQKGESASSRIHILSDPLEAFQYWAEYELPYETAQPLLAVHEDDEQEEEGQPENHVVPMNPECCVGWIVAVAPGRVGLGHYRSQPVKRSKKEDNNSAGDDKDKTKKEGSDKYNLTTIHAPHNTAAGVFLPLARFEASSRTSPETARLFQNLERTCLDFLDCVKIPAMTAAANDAVAEALLPANTTTDDAATSVVDATAASTDAANPAVAATTQTVATENHSSIQTPVVAEPNTVATTTTNRSVLHHALEAAEPSYAATTNIAASDHHHQAPSFSFNEPRTDVTVEGCEMRYCALCDELVLKWLPCPRGCDSSPEPIQPGKKMPPPSQSQQQDHNLDEALPLPNASDDISTTAVAPVLLDEIHATEETKEDLPPQWAQWLREALSKPNRDDISTTAVAPAAEAETRRTNSAVHVVLVSEEEERSHATTTTGNFHDEWDRDGGIEMSDSLYNVGADPDPLSNVDVDGGHFSQQQQQQLNNLWDDEEQQSRRLAGHARVAQDDSQEEQETESEFHDERTVASWSTTMSTAENVVTTQPREEFEFATIPRSANEDEPVHKACQLFGLWGRRGG